MAESKKTPSASKALGGESKKKEPEKKPESKGKKGKHKHKRTVIDHHTDGSHTVTHEPLEPGGEAVSYARPDYEAMKAGLDEHLGEGAGEGPAAGAAPEPAPGAGAPGAMPA